MKGHFVHRLTSMVVFSVAFLALLVHIASAQQPFASAMSEDGTQYSFHRTGFPITMAAAAAKCAAVGGKLASLTSAEQVRDTLWSPDVVEAAAPEETALLWTGLKITWPATTAAANHRRMLRGTDTRSHPDTFSSYSTASASSNNQKNNHDGKNENLQAGKHHVDGDVDGLMLLERLSHDMDASTDFVVPTHTRDGRRLLPQLLRLWLFQQHQESQQSKFESLLAPQPQFRRALRARDGLSPLLDDAVLTWADGSPADFVLANAANMGFLACNRKKLTECCAAVFDVGPGPYPGADFPTLFFYPCGGEKVAGAAPPTGFVCAVQSPVAELPRPTKAPSPSKAVSPGAAPACIPGAMPAAKSGSHACVKCRPNTYSLDGLKCKKCPAGTKSTKGSAACN